MTHRPAASTEIPASQWPADEGEDSIEFAEFTGDDASSEDAPTTQVGVDAVPTTETAPPAWFRRKSAEPAQTEAGVNADASSLVVAETSVAERATARKRKPRKPAPDDAQKPETAKAGVALIEVADEESQEVDWRRDWKKLALVWLVSNASCGYGVSFIVHTILLAAMSIIVYHSMDDNQAISMIITDADAMPVEFTEIMDLTVEPAGGSENQLPQLTQIPITSAEAEISSSLLDSTASIAGNNGEGGATDEGFGFMFSMPEGGKVVSKGSFSAWTVPEDPEPRKDYMIVIRIRLPEKTNLYRISDLSGKVEGSDFYVQHLPFDPSRKELAARSERSGQIVTLRASDRLRVIKDHVQIMIPVKGGDTLVRDTIHVRSRMLNEDQRLEIEF